MMHRKKENYWRGAMLMLLAPAVILLLQAFSNPEVLVGKTREPIPVVQVDKAKEWLEKWNFENIGNEDIEPKIFNEDLPNEDNNVLEILMNRNDDILVEEQFKTKDEIKEIVKDFLCGKNGSDYQEEKIPNFGKMKVSKGAVNVVSGLDTSDELINFTLKSIGEAYLEVRKERSESLFGRDYFALDKKKRQAIDMLVPIQFVYEHPNANLLKEKAESKVSDNN